MSIICEICLEEYHNSFNSEKTPRILECGDTFCTQCLKKMKKNQEKIICPVCRAESYEEIEKIRVNKYIINQIEKKILSAIKHLDKEIEPNKIDFKFSIALIGESGTGKTSIGHFYNTGKSFDISPLTTISLENSYKFLSIHSKTVKITLWDTAGQEKYRSISNGYIRGVDAIILVFSLTNYIGLDEYEDFIKKSEKEKNKIKEDYKNKTFEELNYWLKHCKQINVQKNQIIYLIGNKVDQKEHRLIDREDAEKFANENNLKYYETSAKTGEKINEMFNSLSLDLMKIYSDDLDSETDFSTDNISLTKRNHLKCKKGEGCLSTFKKKCIIF